jgi:hypothetical protein
MEVICGWCLQVLQQLASLQPAVDEEGAVLQPLPRAHRGIADPACLPHIAQVMLTGADWVGHCAHVPDTVKAILLACGVSHNASCAHLLYGVKQPT